MSDLLHVREPSGHLVSELHGVTLKQILEHLVDRLGWDALAAEIRINCFAVNPSIKSSLTFLRRTPWARAKVEELYIQLRSEELLAGTRSPRSRRARSSRGYSPLASATLA